MNLQYNLVDTIHSEVGDVRNLYFFTYHKSMTLLSYALFVIIVYSIAWRNYPGIRINLYKKKTFYHNYISKDTGYSYRVINKYRLLQLYVDCETATLFSNIKLVTRFVQNANLMP